MKHLLLALVLVGLDQASKLWARTELSGVLELLPNVALRFSENTGIAFSLPVPYWVTIPLSLVVIFFLVRQLWQRPHKPLVCMAFGLILAGAIGNLIDRVLYGAVTDFISVYSFPIFNLADSFITVGVILYLWEEIVGS